MVVQVRSARAPPSGAERVCLESLKSSLDTETGREAREHYRKCSGTWGDRDHGISSTGRDDCAYGCGIIRNFITREITWDDGGSPAVAPRLRGLVSISNCARLWNQGLPVICLPGVSIKYSPFLACMWKAVSKGFVGPHKGYVRCGWFAQWFHGRRGCLVASGAPLV